MCRLLIHAYTVSLLTPRYSAISSTDNQRLGITLSSIAKKAHQPAIFGSSHGYTPFGIVQSRFHWNKAYLIRFNRIARSLTYE